VRRRDLILGIIFLSLGLLLYQSALNQNDEIEEFIVVELDVGNLTQQMYCVVMIDNQCEVRDVEYGGRSIEELDKMTDRMENTIAMSRVSFVIGVFLTLFSIKKELLRTKSYLWD
jgi:hypothetical protein